MNRIQYRILTWQESCGQERKWYFVIKRYRRVVFKRSKREGWRGEGFVTRFDSRLGFTTRPEALAAAKIAKKELTDAE